MARPDLENQRYIKPLYVDDGKVDGLFTVGLSFPGLSARSIPSAWYWVAPFACEVISVTFLAIVPEWDIDCAIGVVKGGPGDSPEVCNLAVNRDMNFTVREINFNPPIEGCQAVTIGVDQVSPPSNAVLAPLDMLGLVNNSAVALHQADSFVITILMKRL